jgi:predicted RNase H-like HicB family nuclease
MKQFTLSRNSDGEWTVTCTKVPGLVIKAKTRHEAIEKMKNAVKLYFPCGDCKGSS